MDTIRVKTYRTTDPTVRGSNHHGSKLIMNQTLILIGPKVLAKDFACPYFHQL